ncbi:H-NS family nucleoid-associated regulatory protein [Piscinibacter koreensis]|uniref:H-NS histone family protein n=1 Tax=Piscinibacter koreensis TaxID=2742824 RepID=A0A7Y6NQY4_9BURK|nr:H-NS family nucleoid-associated regulatory protein [Schlegelella koreensis]NUZ07676.1 H-NS histone family protein [Schlegelella koreensis]
MPKTYAQLNKELQALQAEADRLKKQEAGEVIGKIREAISTYGLTERDLFGGKRAGAGKSAAKKAGKKAAGSAPKYADGNGNVWGGMGPRPRWLRDALSSGGKLEDFLADGSQRRGTPEQEGEQDSSTPQGESSDAGASRKSSPGRKASAKKARRAGVAYTDGTQTWSGMGPRPGWLKKALAAGRSLEEFRAQ